MPWEETWILGILGCGLGRKGGGLSGSRYGLTEGGGFILESYVLQGPLRKLLEAYQAFRTEYWVKLSVQGICLVRVFWVCLAIGLQRCYTTRILFRREYNFLVLTLGTVYITIRKKICDFRWCNGTSLHLNASQNILRMGQNMFFKKYILPVINYKKEIKHEVCLSLLVYYDALKCIR